MVFLRLTHHLRDFTLRHLISSFVLNVWEVSDLANVQFVFFSEFIFVCLGFALLVVALESISGRPESFLESELGILD